jgi:hypothetical protein
MCTWEQWVSPCPPNRNALSCSTVSVCPPRGRGTTPAWSTCLRARARVRLRPNSGAALEHRRGPRAETGAPGRARGARAGHAPHATRPHPQRTPSSRCRTWPCPPARAARRARLSPPLRAPPRTAGAHRRARRAHTSAPTGPRLPTEEQQALLVRQCDHGVVRAPRRRLALRRGLRARRQHRRARGAAPPTRRCLAGRGGAGRGLRPLECVDVKDL